MNTVQTVMSREQYFGSKLQQLQGCGNFDDLLAISIHLKEEFDTIDIKVDGNVNIVEKKLIVEKTASDLLQHKSGKVPSKFATSHPVCCLW